VSILNHFFDTTTLTVYVSTCRGPNLEKSFIFGKQMRLKTTDNVPCRLYMYTTPNVGGLLTNYFTRTLQVGLELTKRTVACVVHSRTILCLNLMTLNPP